MKKFRYYQMKFSNGIGKRVLSLLLVVALAFSLIQSIPGGISSVQAAGRYQVTIHYLNSGSWSNVNAYVAEGDNWDTITGYEAYKDWPGVAVEENAEHANWFDLVVEKDSDAAIKCIFNNGEGTQTSDLTVTITSETQEVWCVNNTIVYEAPGVWTGEAEEEQTTSLVSDYVQVAIGDERYDMSLYMNGVYEAKVSLEAGTYQGELLINGEEAGCTTDVTVADTQEVYFRFQNGELKDSVNEDSLIHTAAFTGNFAGLEFVDKDQKRYDIASWTPKDTNAELDYIGGGIYSRTFMFLPLTEDLTLEDGGYKVSFDDDWVNALGSEGGGNIAVTIPAGSDRFTLWVDEINGVVLDSVRTAGFEVAQNNGTASMDAFATVSLVGPAREAGDNNWNQETKGYEFEQISETLYRYQKFYTAGSYEYKCVFNYSTWYEAEAGNRSFNLTEDQLVVILYDTTTGKLADSVNNTSDVAIALGMESAPAEAKVTDNANGTTTFQTLADPESTVELFYGAKADVENSGSDACTQVTLKENNGVYTAEDIFFGDASVDLVYYYEVNGTRILDGSAEKVTVSGEEYSSYTREAFTGRTVNVPGTFPGPSWDAASNEMTYQGNGIYHYTFENVPAANYEYKISFASWAENYGVGGVAGGANYPVAVPERQDVTIYYNDFSHRSVNSIDYQFADVDLLGTGIPEGTKLTDNDLTGIYSVTVALQPGTYDDIRLVCEEQEYPIGEFVLENEKAITFYFEPSAEIYYCNASDIMVEEEHVFFNSKDDEYKSVFGAVATDEEVTFAISTGTDAESVSLIVKGKDGKNVSMEKDGEAVNGVQRWTTTTSFDSLGEYTYYFTISNGFSVKIYGDDDGYYGVGKVSDLTDLMAYDLVVYQAGYETPDWVKDAVIYQIFPDRFFDGDESNNQAQTTARGEADYEYVTDWYTLPENPEQEALLTEEEYAATGAYVGDTNWSNEIYGGDLEGITDRIDYLKALGVTVIYINPVFSSISSHRYDTSDYNTIDPVLGDLGDFQELVEAADANDMHIILDGVFNHVSDDSKYFDRYYKFLEAGTDTVGAYPYWAYVYDMMSEEGVEKAEAEEAAKAYFTENYGITDFSYTEWFDVFSDSMLTNDAGEAVCDNIGQRAGKPVYGYDGWWGYDSMPVVKSTNGSEYQTGNWAEEIIYSEDESSVTQYWLSEGSDGWRLDVANEVSDETWQEFRESVKALNSDAVIIGEIWDDATEYILGDMYDSVMNYVFRNAVLAYAMGDTSENSMNTLEKLRERYPEEAFYAMMNLVGSHDTSRVLSYLDGVEDDRNQKDIEHAFPTYENTSDLAKERQYLVAFLQFTYAGAPTIYYGDEIGMVGADDPDDRRAFEWGKGNQELVTWYASLGAIRGAYAALRTGSVEPFETGFDNIMSYVRRDEDNAMIVLANNGQEAQSVTLDLQELNVSAETLQDLIAAEDYEVSGDTVTVTVPALSGVILVDESETVVAITVDQAALAPAYDASYIIEERDPDKVFDDDTAEDPGQEDPGQDPGQNNPGQDNQGQGETKPSNPVVDQVKDEINHAGNVAGNVIQNVVNKVQTVVDKIKDRVTNKNNNSSANSDSTNTDDQTTAGDEQTPASEETSEEVEDTQQTEDSEEAEKEENTEIGEESTPTSANSEEAGGFNWPIALGGGLLVVAAAGGVSVYTVKRKRQ